MSCCPSESWGKLGAGDYTPKGTVTTVGDLPIYRVGSGENCIIWCYDIYGFDSGRTKQTADLFAENGFQVIMPDFFRGEMKEPTDPACFPFIKKITVWSELEKDWKEKILPFATEHGAKRFAGIGTCWGSYVVLHLSWLDQFVAGVSWHPSHSLISKGIGEDLKAMFENVKCPQLFMPAGGDAAEDCPGGLASQVMGDKLEIVEFKEMKHGWTVRGDMSDATIKRDVEKALTLSLEYLKKQFQ